MVHYKMVRLHDATFDMLQKAKVIPDESYDSLFRRLISAYERSSEGVRVAEFREKVMRK